MDALVQHRIAGLDRPTIGTIRVVGQRIDRLTDAVDAQRRFLAYAAHELRGGITLQITLAQATLADPDADTASLREMGEGVVAACWRQERLLEALLALARSDYGHLRREPVDLAVTAAEVLRAHARRGLGSAAVLATARTTGDPQLIERLLANLIDNAVRHNVKGGRIDVTTDTCAGRAVFTIANTGPVIPAGELTRLFQPFQQLSSHERPSADGVGLGLAIVQAIASVHDATLTAHAPAGGGLAIDVAFPLSTEWNGQLCDTSR
jgi:signal transduction histidine kinase